MLTNFFEVKKRQKRDFFEQSGARQVPPMKSLVGLAPPTLFYSLSRAKSLSNPLRGAKSHFPKGSGVALRSPTGIGAKRMGLFAPRRGVEGRGGERNLVAKGGREPLFEPVSRKIGSPPPHL